ncbi:MAG: hypothetical protein KBT10_02485, partial [Bacteroidales bacterium]|nr:hypothetical protein [Candidatus Sodaliphilus aphodohippi]
LKPADVVTFEFSMSKNDYYSQPEVLASLEYTGNAVSDAPHLPLTVTADDQHRFVEAADPELTWTPTGALFPDDELDGITIDREPGEEPADYAISLSQSEGANPDYDITLVDGTFTIINSAHHLQSAATDTTRGFTQECWEDLTDYKIYADGYGKQELNAAVVVTYSPFKNNPVTSSGGFYAVEDGPYEDSQFYWSSRTDYRWRTDDYAPRYVEYQVYGSDADNARIKMFKSADSPEGDYKFKVYVNGESVYEYSEDKNHHIVGLYSIPVPGVKTGDVVRFEVTMLHCPVLSGLWLVSCLDYTSSNGGGEGVVLTATQDPADPEHYYTTYFSSESSYAIPYNVTAYTGVVDGNLLRLTAIEGNVIPAGEPVVLQVTAEPQTVSSMLKDGDAAQIQFGIAKTDATAPFGMDNELLGTDNLIQFAPNNTYGLSLGDDGIGFYPYNGGQIEANTALLKFRNPVDIAMFQLSFEGSGDIPTGVEDLKHDRQGDGRKYDILGRPVGDDYKGIVIMNGRKFVVK